MSRSSRDLNGGMTDAEITAKAAEMEVFAEAILVEFDRLLDMQGAPETLRTYLAATVNVEDRP